MKLIISRHARNRNRKINASPEELLEAIEYPDSRYVGERNRLVAIKAVENKLLKVVYTVEEDGYHIITIIDRNQ